ncbi:MAG: A24 family peptidase [Eubacteriales bacterium]|nr:A24 family peptidase [Eubacteriales bacterium]
MCERRRAFWNGVWKPQREGDLYGAGLEVFVTEGLVSEGWRGVSGAGSIIVLCVVLAGAAWTDVRSGKVRNGWLLLGMAAELGCVGAEFLPAAGVMLIPVWFLFRLRMLGAGDGKLMVLIAGALGFWRGLTAVWTGLLVGAIWSICRIRQGESFQARFRYLHAYFMQMISQQRVMAYEDFSGAGGRHRIPLAVCLAAGVYLYLLISRITGRGIG